MFDSNDRDASRSTLRLGFVLAVFVWAMAVASYALGAEPQWSLSVGTATAAPQTAVEIPVVLTSREAAVSAVAFTIEFDSSKLVLDGGPTLGSKFEIPAPAMFTSSSWVGTEAGDIGVVVYDRTRPIGVLADGTIVRLRFRPLADSSGFAFVRVSTAKPFSGSGPRGEWLEGEILAGGGVTILVPAGSNTSAVEPRGRRERLHRDDTPRDAIPLVAIPLVSADAPGGSAHWRTSLVLHNSGAVPAAVRLMLVREQSGARIGPIEVSVPPGATRTWSDPGMELFGIASARGALSIERSSIEVRASASTGASLIDAAPATVADTTLLALGASPELAIANLDGTEARFAIELRDVGGALVAASEVTVGAGSVTHAIELSPPANASQLTAIIRPLGAPARYLAWATASSPDSAPLLQLAR